jgi:hypothetical protein
MTGKCLPLCLAISIASVACKPEGASLGADLPSGVVATAGEQLVSGALVERISAAQHLKVRPALDAALSDAVYAAEAVARGGILREEHARRIALARVFLESLREEARRQGPPTDDEVRTLTESRFWDFDRPEMRRTTHAVIEFKNPKKEAAAREAAEAVAAAVAGATDAKTFRAQASRVKPEKLTVRVEDLEPVTSDGRAVDPKAPPPPGQEVARYAAEFCAAVFAIPEVKAQSPIVRTGFGYHVILLTEVIPAQRIEFEKRRSKVVEEVLTRRAQAILDPLRERLRGETPWSVERSASELTEKVRVGQ